MIYEIIFKSLKNNTKKERNDIKMKKRVLFVLLTIVLILPFIKVKAGSMDSYVDWTLDRSVFAHQYRNGSDHITNLAMMTTNGVTAYCIEPGITADKASYYSSTTNIYDTKLVNVNTKKLSLIGYYGYGYEGHNAKEYYMAAQELIWRESGVENVWWTDAKEGGNILNIDYYKNEILSLVNNYEVAPTFNFKKEYMVGDEITLSDANNVLNGYEVVGNNDVKIENNQIKIKVKDANNNFILRRKQNGKNTKFYYKDGYQTIGSFEFPYDFQKSYNINSFYGKIIIDKLDDETKSKETSSKEASLEGATYGLYDKDDNLIKTGKTDENGMIIFDNLSENNYRIKEISPSVGYTKSLTTFSTYLGTNNKEVIIKSYEKIIKNKIYVTKVLDDEENKVCTPEEGIIFHVYDDEDNFIMEVITDKDGNVSFELPYGKYILKQISTNPGIDKVKDRIIEVKEDGATQNIALVNHRLPEEQLITYNEDLPTILPNTGKKSFIVIPLLLILNILGYLYEKKYI